MKVPNKMFGHKSDSKLDVAHVQTLTLCSALTHLPDEAEVMLLDTQELAGAAGHDGALPRQVLQDGLSEGGAHAECAQRHGHLQNKWESINK